MVFLLSCIPLTLLFQQVCWGTHTQETDGQNSSFDIMDVEHHLSSSSDYSVIRDTLTNHLPSLSGHSSGQEVNPIEEISFENPLNSPLSPQLHQLETPQISVILSPLSETFSHTPPIQKIENPIFEHILQTNIHNSKIVSTPYTLSFSFEARPFIEKMCCCSRLWRYFFKKRQDSPS